MVKVYASAIINGLKGYDDVPVKIKADVKAELIRRGYGHLVIEEEVEVEEVEVEEVEEVEKDTTENE